MTSGHYCDGCAQAYYKCVCDKPVEQKKTSSEQSDQIPNDSPTAGMTLEERIKHVGGRKNAAGYIEFGSVMAVDALIRHVLRDLPAEHQEKSPEQTDHSAVHLHHCNIGEYEGSCKYGDENCPAMAHAALKAKWAPVQPTHHRYTLELPQGDDRKVTIFFSEHEVKDGRTQHHLCINVKPEAPPKNIRVHGWVWKDKQSEDDCYIPSYTPAQHVPKGELLALVDPADLHEPLQNTKWF